MLVNVWLKSQPNKKIPFPDCYHIIVPKVSGRPEKTIIYDNKENYVVAEYAIESLKKVEFWL